MNSVHLVTQEKKRVKTDRKWVECTECTAQGQPRCPGHARPARPAPACRAPSALPSAQRPAARPAPCHPPAPEPSCRSPARARQRPCACRPARPSTLALRATPAHACLPRAPGTPSTHARPAPAARSPPSQARPAPASLLPRHARAPARLAYRIVALTVVSWALAARQPGRIAGTVPCTPQLPSPLSQYKL